MLKMSTLKAMAVMALVLTTIAVAISIVSLVTVLAQPKGAKAPTLTALDYAEIQELNNHAAHAFDTCADKGNEWANLFTTDGVFIRNGVKYERRESLAALAGGPNCPPHKNLLNIRHITANAMIEPSPDGAIGKSYVLLVNIGKDGKTGELTGGAKYYDVYLKTSEGWRFKSRDYVQSPHFDLIPSYEQSR